MRHPGRIAVVGATGYIGCQVVLSLQSAGLEVRPIVRRTFPSPPFRELDTLVADALRLEDMCEAFRDCATVVHTIAGTPNDIVAAIEPLFVAAEKMGVSRIVYLSSASVHGQSPAPDASETSPLSSDQAIAYNNSKVLAERRLLEFSGSSHIEVVILRPGIVHGPRSRWIIEFADQLRRGTAALVDGGRGVCNSIYLGNLVEVIRLACVSELSAKARIFIVGDEEHVTWSDLYQPVAQVVGKSLESLPEPAESDSSFGSLLFRVANSKLAARAISQLPPLRVGTTTLLRFLRPPMNVEMRTLQACSVKLPHLRARIELGYQAPVRFGEASAVTKSWLLEAGYGKTLSSKDR